MTSTRHNIDKLFGVYRGKVLKHLPHGRCKIYIPEAYHEDFSDKPDALPSAEQASPLFAGVNNGNGVFSYPNIGATVLCMFLNGDANLPVYFAATLAGENAFGQYTIIKKDLKEENGEQIESTEPISERHLVTSGKTHIEWYENGKISAIVEDPIRTICSVDYDSWEKNSDNISADDKYKSKLSNDNVWKIRDNKLSNIDCQLVLDNNGESHGKLSTSTHWYDIVDSDQQTSSTSSYNKPLSSEKGTISTDNWHVMHNNGEIKYGTLSTKCMSFKDETTTDDTQVSVNNTYSLSVPGIMDHKVFIDGKFDKTDTKAGSADHTELSSWTKEHHDTSANAWIKSYRDQKSNVVAKGKATTLTSILSNSFSMLSDGSLALSSNKLYSIIEASSIKNEDISSVISSSCAGNSTFRTASALTSIANSTILNAKLSNQIEMQDKGEISVFTRLDKTELANSLQTKFDGWSKSVLDVDGMHQSKSKWHMFQSSNGNSQDIDNQFTYIAENKRNASLQEKVTSVKTASGTKIVDFSYLRKLEAQASTVDITITDDIAQNEAAYLNNLSKGSTTLQIKSKQTGMMCTITIDAFGKMTINTTDKLDIQTTNSVTVTSPQITMNGTTTINGPTTVNSTLHVTSQTTIDADAIIGGKSFLGHMHVGNMGAPTSPPI